MVLCLLVVLVLQQSLVLLLPTTSQLVLATTTSLAVMVKTLSLLVSEPTPSTLRLRMQTLTVLLTLQLVQVVTSFVWQLVQRITLLTAPLQHGSPARPHAHPPSSPQAPPQPQPQPQPPLLASAPPMPQPSQLPPPPLQVPPAQQHQPHHPQLAAHAQAQGVCGERGAPCRPALEFTERCGAVAQARRTLGLFRTSDPRTYSVSYAAAGSGNSQQAAEANAMDQCRARERTISCEIVASQCGRP